jgi:hypothetical protein
MPSSPTFVKALAKSDDRSRESVAKIITVWDEFKQSDEHARKIACKGKDKESREVAMLIRRKHRGDIAQNRERVSVQGKAIKIARKAYWIPTEENPEPVCKTPEQLQEKISILGIKGLLKLVPKGESKSKKITIPVPDRWTLHLIGPDSTRKEVPDEIAQPVIARMQGLQ